MSQGGVVYWIATVLLAVSVLLFAVFAAVWLFCAFRGDDR